MLFLFVVFFVATFAQSVVINAKKNKTFFLNKHLNKPIIPKCNKKKRLWNMYSSNVVYKQIQEKTQPFKKYCIGDIFYGKVLSVNKHKIKLDILCDRKADLNTNEYFQETNFKTYIYTLVQINNIIKVKIKYINKIQQKIIVSIRKYTFEEIISSFKEKKNLLLNVKILSIGEKEALLYVAPKIHAYLSFNNEQDFLSKYKVGQNMLVSVYQFDAVTGKLHVR
ncbi:conserved protein, unknown function [Hepatocystis sp. ex Piliocolobus tephrosceles]|nr:conserved protein, unknown function [Hepatocystis sp. ex Piliocolobus tephrosceles]